MTISKDQVHITTLNAVIGLTLGIGAIFAIFYTAQASDKKDIADISERVAKLEAVLPETNRRLEGIEGALQSLTSELINKKK
jgi:hypothetical protein